MVGLPLHTFICKINIYGKEGARAEAGATLACRERGSPALSFELGEDAATAFMPAVLMHLLCPHSARQSAKCKVQIQTSGKCRSRQTPKQSYKQELIPALPTSNTCEDSQPAGL